MSNKKFLLLLLLFVLFISVSNSYAQDGLGASPSAYTTTQPTLYQSLPAWQYENRDRVDHCLQPKEDPRFVITWRSLLLVDAWDGKLIIQVKSPTGVNGLAWVGCNTNCGPGFNTAACGQFR